MRERDGKKDEDGNTELLLHLFVSRAGVSLRKH